MKAKLVHENLHVLDLDASIAFYQMAFGLEVLDATEPEDGSWRIVFMGNDQSDFRLELTWNKGRVEPYNNGDRDTHLAFAVPDMDEAHKLHEEMGIICHENPNMGIYFVNDPDGCWLEVVPLER